MAQPDFSRYMRTVATDQWNNSPSRHSGVYSDVSPDGMTVRSHRLTSAALGSPATISTLNLPVSDSTMANPTYGVWGEAIYPPANRYRPDPALEMYAGEYAQAQYTGIVPSPPGWEQAGFVSSESLGTTAAVPSSPIFESDTRASGSSLGMGEQAGGGRVRHQRRPSNRDEFDGPHQFLQRPSLDIIALQDRELPVLPTHLLVHEQDHVLAQVNDRLSQCAFDFVAKYQFPIPLTRDMRPVERPQDREWTEWVILLKRLATKRRIPARVLYNGQIRQLITILENSLEMRHAAKHQSRPLKDDRNVLQLISAGIQVAKILKDAQAMDYLDRLYVETERRIQDRSNPVAAARSR